MQHLNMPNLRGTTEEAEDEYGGSQRDEPDPDPDPTKQGGKAKKGRKVKTRTWSDMVKGLKKEDEQEIENSDKSGNKL